MNKKTSKVLERISRNVPRHLSENITKTVVDTSEEDIARDALRSPGISPYKKKKIQKLLDQGAFRRSEEVENEEVIEQIDKYNDKAVKKAIKDGLIPPPEQDSWMAKRNQKIKNPMKISGKIIPTKERVLIRPQEATKEKNAFGIVLPDSMKKKSAIGIVEAVGADVRTVVKGLKVAYQDYDYEPIELDGVLFYIMKEQNIIAIFI